MRQSSSRLDSQSKSDPPRAVLPDLFIPPLGRGEPGWRGSSVDENHVCAAQCGPWHCTLDPAHKPPHLAHGTGDYIYAVWYDDWRVTDLQLPREVVGSDPDATGYSGEETAQ